MVSIVYSVALVSLLVTATGSVESSSRPTSGLQVSSKKPSGTTSKSALQVSYEKTKSVTLDYSLSEDSYQSGSALNKVVRTQSKSRVSSSIPKSRTTHQRASVTTQTSYDALCDQAESAIESGKFEKAASLASRAEGMRPDGWRGYFLVGRSAFYRDNADLADMKMRKALSLAPPSVRDGISRGIEAIQNLKLYTGYITEAESKKASGQVMEAAESFASAFRTSPTHYQIGLQAADLFDQLGQYDRELDILQSLSQVAVSESIRQQVSLAMSAAARKKDEAAERQLVKEREDREAAERAAFNKARQDEQDRKDKAEAEKRAKELEQQREAQAKREAQLRELREQLVGPTEELRRSNEYVKKYTEWIEDSDRSIKEHRRTLQYINAFDAVRINRYLEEELKRMEGLQEDLKEHKRDAFRAQQKVDSLNRRIEYLLRNP